MKLLKVYSPQSLSFILDFMPKRKTGQRKKAEKQKERQKLLQLAYSNKELVQWPCDFLMVRIEIRKKIKTNRYFLLDEMQTHLFIFIFR